MVTISLAPRTARVIDLAIGERSEMNDKAQLAIVAGIDAIQVSAQITGHNSCSSAMCGRSGPEEATRFRCPFNMHNVWIPRALVPA